MRYYGIHVHHDAGIAILEEDGTLAFLGLAERYVRKRHCVGYLEEMLAAFPSYAQPRPGDVISWVRGDSYEAPNDPVANDSQFRKWSARFGEADVTSRDLPRYGPGVARGYDVAGGLRLLCLDHHAAHAAAAWCFRPDDRARLFVAADGGGLNVDNVQLFSAVGSISGDSFAVEELDSVPTSYPIEKVFGELNYKAGALMGLAGYRPDAPHHARDWLTRGVGVAGQPLRASDLTEEQISARGSTATTWISSAPPCSR
jgi:predicted NodU family carbamoyl transferase